MQAALVHQYWQERLREGSVFYRLDQARPGRDFRRDPSDAPLWPRFVCRDALYTDFTSWTDLPRCTKVEFFKALTPFLYPWGKENMVARFEVEERFVSGSGISMKKRKQRYFAKMLPLHVARAVAHRRWNIGNAVAKLTYETVIDEYREALVATD